MKDTDLHSVDVFKKLRECRKGDVKWLKMFDQSWKEFESSSKKVAANGEVIIPKPFFYETLKTKKFPLKVIFDLLVIDDERTNIKLCQTENNAYGILRKNC